MSSVSIPDLTGKVVVVTGANTGIGKETARGLLKYGATTVVACRDRKKGRAAAEEIGATTGYRDRVHVLSLDLGDFASIRRFAAEVTGKFGRLDVLVNNAGAWPTTRQVTKDGLETTFGTNHVGPFLLTTELLPLLEASGPARIVNVSSALHYRGKMAFDDLQFEKRPYGATAAYNQSKLANVLFTNALSRRLAGRKVTVNALHPGVVATELIRDLPSPAVALAQMFMMTPEEGAKTSLFLAMSPEVEGITGKYFEHSKEKRPAAEALDEAAQEKLWSLTEALVAQPKAKAA